jgi:hypothetical protein
MGFAACGDDGDDGDQNSGNNNSGATGSTGTTGDTAATGDTGTTPFTGATGTGGTVTAVDSTSNLDVASIRYFATSSPWNTSAQGLPVADDSARMLDLAVQRIAVREVPGKEGVVTFIRRRPEALTINTLAWGPVDFTPVGDGP